MTKSHLVPTPIVDKNGKPTTTYTKPSQTAAKKLAMPSPVVPSLKDRQIDDIVVHVAGSMSLDEMSQYDDIRQLLSDYPDILIKRIADAISEQKLPYITAALIGNKSRAATVEEALTFHRYMDTDSPDQAWCVMRGLHHYAQLPKVDDFSLTDEATQKQVIALIIATEIMDNDWYFNSSKGLPLGMIDTPDGKIEIINDPKIVDLLMERPERAAQIADIIVERKSTDIDLIVNILNMQNSDIAEGVL